MTSPDLLREAMPAKEPIVLASLMSLAVIFCGVGFFSAAFLFAFLFSSAVLWAFLDFLIIITSLSLC